MNKTIEVWALVDPEGNYVASEDEDNLVDRYEEVVQELSSANGYRKIKVSVSVPLPTVLEATADLQEDVEVTATARKD